MIESISLWQQTKNIHGRITSMDPHVCPGGESMALGNISIGFQALSAIAQFGIWYEMHKMNSIAQAQFEERRLQWLDQIIQQWIDEHKSCPGIIYDVTNALRCESDKLLDKLAEIDDMDVPQVLILKVKRINDYFDQLSITWGKILSTLILTSNSDPKFDRKIESSTILTARLIDSTKEAIAKDDNFFTFLLLALPTLFIPVVGPGMAGGLIGGAFSNKFENSNALKKIDKLSKYPDLIRLPIAVEQYIEVSNTVKYIMDKQQLSDGWGLYAIPSKAPNQSEIRLINSSKRGFFSKLFGNKSNIGLREITFPEKE